MNYDNRLVLSSMHRFRAILQSFHFGYSRFIPPSSSPRHLHRDSSLHVPFVLSSGVLDCRRMWHQIMRIVYAVKRRIDPSQVLAFQCYQELGRAVLSSACLLLTRGTHPTTVLSPFRGPLCSRYGYPSGGCQSPRIRPLLTETNEWSERIVHHRAMLQRNPVKRDDVNVSSDTIRARLRGKLCKNAAAISSPPSAYSFLFFLSTENATQNNVLTQLMIRHDADGLLWLSRTFQRVCGCVRGVPVA